MTHIGREWKLLPLAVVLLFAIVPYLPTLRNHFAFDDTELITGDTRPVAQRLRGDFFGEDATGGAASGYYRPVTSLSYALEQKLYGDEPLGYHVHNLALHAGNSALLLTLLGAIPPLAPIALPATLIFAAHPVHAESVAPITGRTDPLAFLFTLLCAHALLRRRHVLATLAFLLALGSKESSVALLPLLSLVPLARSGSRGECLSIAGIGVLLGAAWFALKIGVLGITPPDGVYTGEGNFGQRALTFVAVLPKYLGLLAWPASLSIFHDVPLVTSLQDARLWIGLALLVVLASFVASNSRALAIAAALFLLPLIPASNVIPITYSYDWIPFPFFERYLYVATAGFGIALVFGARNLLRGQFEGDAASKALLACTVITCLALGARTWVRALDFHDDATLFSAAAKIGDGRLEPRIQAAGARFLSGDAAGALEQFDRLLAETKPGLPPNEALILERATVQAAMAQGLRDHARIARAQGNVQLGVALEARSKAIEADALQRLEELRSRRDLAAPGRVFALLGIFHGIAGDPFAAARMFREATLLPGAPPDLANNFKVVIEQLRWFAREFAKSGRAGAPEAISVYRRALEAISGDYPPKEIPRIVWDETLTLWCELADQHVLIGQSGEASAAYVALLALEPTLARCHEGLGFLCKQGGNREAAYDHFETAIELETDSWYAINEMFTMLREDGRHEEAAKYAERFKAYIAKYGKPGTKFEDPPIDAPDDK